MGRLVRCFVALLLLLLGVSAGPPLLLRYLDPPFTGTMLERAWEHEARTGAFTWPTYQPVPLAEQGKWVPKAAVSGEDGWFWQHHGFDPEAIEGALDANESSSRKRGASTISQQVARNAFLWQGRTWVRKGLEAYYTVWLELVVPKERILEVYLNVAETGPMTFGFEAGARHWYGVPAKALTFDQAARIVAILPSPNRYTPGARTEKAQLIQSKPVPFPGERGFGQMEERAQGRFGWDATVRVIERLREE